MSFPRWLRHSALTVWLRGSVRLCNPENTIISYWNCAHPDLQVPYLKGDELFELSNLTPQGMLRFRLPGLTPSLLADMGRSEKERIPLQLDTVIIEPEHVKVSLVWRAFFPASPDILSCEAMRLDNANEFS